MAEAALPTDDGADARIVRESERLPGGVDILVNDTGGSGAARMTIAIRRCPTITPPPPER